MNIMTIGGYQAVIAFDPDMQMFRGEFVGLNGGADFYAADFERIVEIQDHTQSMFVGDSVTGPDNSYATRSRGRTCCAILWPAALSVSFRSKELCRLSQN